MTRHTETMDDKLDELCAERGIERSDLPDMATVDAALNGDYL